MDLASLGTDVEWPDSEAGTALRESLPDQHDLGRLAPLPYLTVDDVVRTLAS